eukprot:4141386-Prymnesium_polylepis.1
MAPSAAGGHQPAWVQGVCACGQHAERDAFQPGSCRADHRPCCGGLAGGCPSFAVHLLPAASWTPA